MATLNSATAIVRQQANGLSGQGIDSRNEAPLTATMETLLTELIHYRQQSEKLKKINTLY